ncbi:MAG: hypothetical protein HQL83_13450, partial [Magnetococcales bacterium]|nr:hypothetical protein [Magnetococcales bacterium]
MKKTALALLSFSLGLAPWVTQASNGYFSHGYGTRNKALAGAGVALPEDAMGIAVNLKSLLDRINRAWGSRD